MPDQSASDARRFGLRLKSVRVLQDREVKDVAAEVGVSPQAWYAYESGRTTFSYTLIPQCARALRVSIGDLVERLYGAEELPGPTEMRNTRRSVGALRMRSTSFEPEFPAHGRVDRELVGASAS